MAYRGADVYPNPTVSVLATYFDKLNARLDVIDASFTSLSASLSECRAENQTHREQVAKALRTSHNRQIQASKSILDAHTNLEKKLGTSSQHDGDKNLLERITLMEMELAEALERIRDPEANAPLDEPMESQNANTRITPPYEPPREYCDASTNTEPAESYKKDVDDPSESLEQHERFKEYQDIGVTASLRGHYSESSQNTGSNTVVCLSSASGCNPSIDASPGCTNFSEFVHGYDESFTWRSPDISSTCANDVNGLTTHATTFVPVTWTDRDDESSTTAASQFAPSVNNPIPGSSVVDEEQVMKDLDFQLEQPQQYEDPLPGSLASLHQHVFGIEESTPLGPEPNVDPSESTTHLQFTDTRLTPDPPSPGNQHTRDNQRQVDYDPAYDLFKRSLSPVSTLTTSDSSGERALGVPVAQKPASPTTGAKGVKVEIETPIIRRNAPRKSAPVPTATSSAKLGKRKRSSKLTATPKKRGRPQKVKAAPPSPRKLQDPKSASNIGNMWHEKTNDDAFGRQLIQCDKCNLWYHYRCVGILVDDQRLDPDESFYCPTCESPTNDDVTASTDYGEEQCCRPDCDSRGEGPVDIFFVEKIVGRMSYIVHNTSAYYWLVKWDGYPLKKDGQWMRTVDMGDAAPLIKKFNDDALAEGLRLATTGIVLLKEAYEAGWEGGMHELRVDVLVPGMVLLES
ncbi:hypothetical protein BD410DRAFT_788221 [Rickenella mellea]|uniref:Chromo domain-containing protein n=1 Tax=Rickenella mellea TaxID=50990 RepID=A0A4Y7Q6L2_9AGAM|nr:hypothetical protein BD410DRAFT_788221 [Rickenella mellea]